MQDVNIIKRRDGMYQMVLHNTMATLPAHVTYGDLKANSPTDIYSRPFNNTSSTHDSMLSGKGHTCDVPVIMFLMKSRCPGASITVMKYFSVSNFQRAMSMVIPRSRSAFSLSSTQAYLKEPLPICKSCIYIL